MDTQGWKAPRRTMLEKQHALLRESSAPDALPTLSRHGLTDRLGRDRSGMQDTRQAAFVPRRDALDGIRCASDLSLRALLLSETRWDQFWRKIEQFGVPKIVIH